jgi:hypothetical protein
MELKEFIDSSYPVKADFARACDIDPQNVHQYLRRGNTTFVAAHNGRLVVAVESKVIDGADFSGFVIDEIKLVAVDLKVSELAECVKILKDEIKGRK